MAGDDMQIFDRRLVRRHRDRAAAGAPAHGFLVREVAARLAERLDDVRRRFPTALALGAHGGALAAALAGRGGIETLVQCDPGAGVLARLSGLRVAAEEELLPFAPARFDLVVGCLGLHWANDLPGALVQVREALRPDGLFLAALFGSGTLQELREAFVHADLETSGGASPRVSPFADLRDAAGLLQRAGFALPVADADTIRVDYPDPLALMRDLRFMGEANALIGRRRAFTRRDTLAAALARYRAAHGDAAGRVPATFRVLTLTAWSPAPSQPQPLPPGSAQARLADALGTTEHLAPAKPPRR